MRTDRPGRVGAYPAVPDGKGGQRQSERDGGAGERQDYWTLLPDASNRLAVAAAYESAMDAQTAAILGGAALRAAARVFDNAVQAELAARPRDVEGLFDLAVAVAHAAESFHATTENLRQCRSRLLRLAERLLNAAAGGTEVVIEVRQTKGRPERWRARCVVAGMVLGFQARRNDMRTGFVIEPSGEHEGRVEGAPRWEFAGTSVRDAARSALSAWLELAAVADLVTTQTNVEPDRPPPRREEQL